MKAIGEMAEVVGGRLPQDQSGRVLGRGHVPLGHARTDLSHLSLPVLLDTERKITDAGLAQIKFWVDVPQGHGLCCPREPPSATWPLLRCQSPVNQGSIAMRPRQGVSNLFSCCAGHVAAHDEIISHANGSTFLEISKASFRPIRLVAPPPAVMPVHTIVCRARCTGELLKMSANPTPLPPCATHCCPSSSAGRFG